MESNQCLKHIVSLYIQIPGSHQSRRLNISDRLTDEQNLVIAENEVFANSAASENVHMPV